MIKNHVFDYNNPRFEQDVRADFHKTNDAGMDLMVILKRHKRKNPIYAYLHFEEKDLEALRKYLEK